MIAGDKTLRATLTEQKQYVIPMFQRYYSWDKKDWEKLWDDISELRAANKPGKQHFMGTLVFVAEALSTLRIPSFQVIDGQQRMITLSLLLCALRNLSNENGFKDLADEIAETVLLHARKKGTERFRVYPRLRDREDFFASVENRNAEGVIGQALLYFTEQIRSEVDVKTESALNDFFNFLLSGLMFVHINLDGDNPYTIFSSLNSTGKELSEADLIRNFVFMRVTPEAQDEFDTQLWASLENRFLNGKSLDGKAMSAFLRDYLMMGGEYVPPKSTFETFQTRHQNLVDAHKLLAELLETLSVYEMVQGKSKHKSPPLETALAKLRQLDSTTANPLLLHLLALHEHGQLEEDELIECLELLSGFIFRRYVCREQSRGYGRTFSIAIKNIGQSPAADLETYLVQRGFPNDTRFTAELVRFPLYSKPYDRAVLEQMEKSFEHKEAPAMDNPQVEHVMPQTLSAEWKALLGDDWRSLHAQWVDTIGNLTLTGYNQGLSNKTFEKKLVGIEKTKGFKESNFELSKEIAKYTQWGPAEIEQRGKALAEKACSIWQGPAAGASPDGKVIDMDTGGYTKSSTVGRVYQALLDGEWHSEKELEKVAAGDANLSGRLYSIRRRGAKRGLWKLEEKNGKFRLQRYQKAKA